MPMPEQHLRSDLDVNAQHAAFDRHRSGLTIREWDKVSPINGVGPEHFLQNHPVGDGPVYLIEEAGAAIVFQPHKPHVPGHEPIEDAHAEGNAHADKMAADRAHAELDALAQS